MGEEAYYILGKKSLCSWEDTAGTSIITWDLVRSAVSIRELAEVHPQLQLDNKLRFLAGWGFCCTVENTPDKCYLFISVTFCIFSKHSLNCSKHWGFCI